MAKMIQIRHVPEATHRKIKSRAAAAGMSLSDFLRLEVERIASVPSMKEIMARLAKLPPVVLDEPVATTIRRERDRD